MKADDIQTGLVRCPVTRFVGYPLIHREQYARY